MTASLPLLSIVAGGLDDPRVIALLRTHLASARAETAPGSAHALDLDGLRGPDLQFFAAWQGEAAVATGALRRLAPDHAEVKSMHTAAVARRTGVGSAMLRHLIGVARAQGIARLSLETGSWPYFAPAVALYARHGFTPCLPFGDYAADPNSIFMTRVLATDDRG